MKLMESAGLLFPVMTSRVDDLRAAAQYVIRRMEAHPRREKPDSAFVKLLQKYFQIMRMIYRLEHTDAAIAYVSPDDGALVTRISDWLAEHPEERTA